MSLQSVINTALEALGDRTAWLKGVFDGTVVIDTTNLTSTAGHTVGINGNTFEAASSGGQITVPGGITARDVSATNGILANGAGGLTATGSGGVTASTLTTTGNVTVAGTLTATGAIKANGYCYAPVPISIGPVTAGTHTFQASTVALVTNAVAVASVCIWKIDATGALVGTTIRFVSFDATNAITIQDPAGATLQAIRFTAGSPYASTFSYNGTAWIKVDESYHP